MRARAILQRVVQPRLAGIHARRARALFDAVEGLLHAGRASVTGLGRALRTHARMKHAIKRVDRLVGNSKLHAELSTIFCRLANQLLRKTPRPVIVVDYTEIPNGFMALVAAVACRGRASVVYFEVYSNTKYADAAQQRRFLKRLKSVLPSKSRPTLVTDAGFGARWFQDVAKLGWDYVGRVRNQTKFRLVDGAPWLSRAELARAVRAQPRDLGHVWLNKHRPTSHRVVAVHKRVKPRPDRSRGYSTPQKKCRARALEPWVLATSLRADAAAVVGIYALRMQVEETFRDAKNTRWGFCLGHARCRCAHRWSVLLMLCTLASLVTTLVGFAAEATQQHRYYQANTLSTRRVLSLFTLGRFVLQRADSVLAAATLAAATPLLPWIPCS